MAASSASRFPIRCARDREEGDGQRRDRGADARPRHRRLGRAGAHVEKGDPLFSLEAMKMEHGVVAPLAGIVQAVRIAAGQQVEEGMLAVIIEPDPVD